MGSQHLINHDFYNIPNLFVDLRSQEDFFDLTLATTEQIKNQFKAHKVIMAATSAYIHDLLKRNPAQHPTIIMPTNIRSIDLQYIMDFIYQGKVTVPASELENFMSAGAILQIRGLKSKSEMPSNSAGPQIVTKQSDITTTAPGLKPPQQNIVKTQAEKPKGSTGDQAILTLNKFVEEQPIEEENAESSFEAEGSNDAFPALDPTTGQYFDPSNPPNPPNPSNNPNDPPQSSAVPTSKYIECPYCQGRWLSSNVQGLKAHLQACQGSKQGQAQQLQRKEQPMLCQYCDKEYTGKRNLMAHIKRMHKIQDEGSEQDVQEYPGMLEQDSSEATHSSEWQSRPPPPKKKGRPSKASLQKQIPRPVGQVVPAQRPTNEDFNEFQGQEQVPPMPIPVPRMSPSPSTSNNRSQMPTMPMKRPMGSGPMQPRSHVGAVGKRPRTSLPQPQPSQPGGYHQGPPMPSKRFPNLGSGISISFSGESEGGPSGNNSRQPQQAPMRKPMPSTSRGMQQPFSSNNRDHLMPSQQRQRSVDSPVEVKQEPLEEEMNEGYEEEYPNEEYEDYGEEDVEGDVDQEFAQDTEEGIYGEGEYPDEDDDGEVQYDDEEAYQQ